MRIWEQVFFMVSVLLVLGVLIVAASAPRARSCWPDYTQSDSMAIVCK